MKISSDQRGLAGVVEVGLLGLLLLVIVFAGTRVYNAARSADQANREAVKISQTSPDFSQVDKLEEEKKAVEEKPKAETEEPKTVAVAEDKPKTQQSQAKKPDQPTWIELDYLGVSDDGENYTFSASLGASRSGFCKLKFYKGDNHVVAQGTDFDAKSSCSLTVDKDEFNPHGDWEGYVKFYSSDGKVYGATETIELNVPA